MLLTHGIRSQPLLVSSRVDTDDLDGKDHARSVGDAGIDGFPLRGVFHTPFSTIFCGVYVSFQRFSITPGFLFVWQRLSATVGIAHGRRA